MILRSHRGRVRIVFLSFTALLLLVFVSLAGGVSFTEADGIEAYKHAADLVRDYTPRDATTIGAHLAASFILNRISAFGYDASIDTFRAKTPLGEKTFKNVIAELPGVSEDCIVLLSHFDTKPGIGDTFEGANDGASSTGLLMELARVCRASSLKKKFHYSIIFAFMDGEECMTYYRANDGFWGSRHYAKKLKAERRNVVAVIGVDMIGDKSLKLQIPRNGTASLRALALRAANRAGLRQSIALSDLIISDDHQMFLDEGFDAVNLIDFTYGSAPNRNDYWHTMQDTMDKLSHKSFQKTGLLLVTMLAMLEESSGK